MKNFSDTSYNIVYGCDNNYAKYVSVCIQSILDATAKSLKRERERVI